MSEHRRDRTDKELLDAINQLFSEVEPETSEDVDAIVKAVGYDPDLFATRMEAVAKRFAADSPLNWRNKAREELELERQRLETHTAARKGTRTALQDQIRDLLAQFSDNPNVAFAHHRNLDKASDEDLASLIEELEYLIGDKHTSDDE